MEVSLTPAFVREALGLSGPASAAAPGFAYAGVVTDSRKIRPESLFVALPGDRFDGHDFIPQAIASGARGVLCRRGTKRPKSDAHWYEVDDTVAAFRRVSGAWRERFSLPVAAIAGSVGKTTTKELLASILGAKHARVLKTEGSQNGFLGIPMTLLELRADHAAAVVEIGIDEAGAMAKHLALVKPSLALVTAIAPEHLEKLGDLETVAREETEALRRVASLGGAAIVSLDDPWIAKSAASLRGGRVVRATLSGVARAAADCLVGKWTDTGSAGQLVASGMGLEAETFASPLPGVHNARNVLLALAAARAMGLSAHELRQGLSQFRPAPGRSELEKLPDGTEVLRDYYNASPASVEAALTVLSSLRASRPGRRALACLGDMLELGSDEEKLHRELAGPLLQATDAVFLHGPRMLALADELRRRAFPGVVVHSGSHAELATRILEELRPGDALLIKGSRGMRMEEVWKALREKT